MNSFLGGELFTIVATQFEVLFVDNVELGGDDFCIGDALGVGAFDKILNMVGNFGGEFLDDFVVLNGDDGHRGSHERDLADFFLGEVFVLDFCGVNPSLWG